MGKIWRRSTKYTSQLTASHVGEASPPCEDQLDSFQLQALQHPLNYASSSLLSRSPDSFFSSQTSLNGALPLMKTEKQSVIWMWLNTYMSSDELPLPLRVWKLFPKAQRYLESWQRAAMVSKGLQLWGTHTRKRKEKPPSEPLITEHSRSRQEANALWFGRLK